MQPTSHYDKAKADRAVTFISNNGAKLQPAAD